MRFTRLAAAFCGVAMVSGSAHAALSFSTQRTPVTQSAGALERVVLYALSDTSTGSNANVFGGNLTVSTPTPNGLKFIVLDSDQDGTPDTVAAFQTPVTAATRTRADSNVFKLIGATAPDPRDGNQAPTFNNGLTSWSITAAADNNVGYLADNTVNGGKGYAVFAAVVPTGSDVSFAGTVSDGNPTNYPVALTDPGVPVPEPVGLAFLGIGAVGMLGRRARRA
jgi:hypothetical protein